MPIEKIHWDKQDVVKCDERGRATLGKEFANDEVFVYIAETPDIDEFTEPPKEKKRVLTEMHKWGRKHVNKEYMRLNADEGVIVDKYGNEYDTPYKYDKENGVAVNVGDENE